MAQDVNHIMQSYTDVLTVSDGDAGHVYYGKSPVIVDNLNDTISLEPAAVTKIYPTDSINVEQSTNAQGNTVYRLSVDESLDHEYTGEGNIIVDNERNVIYSNNIGFDIQSPLTATINDNTLTLGCDIPITSISQNNFSLNDEKTHTVTSDDIANGFIEEVSNLSTLRTWCSSGIITSPLIISIEVYFPGSFTLVADVELYRNFTGGTTNLLLYRNGFIPGYDSYKTSFSLSNAISLGSTTFSTPWDLRVNISWPNGISPALSVGSEIEVKIRYRATKLVLS